MTVVGLAEQRFILSRTLVDLYRWAETDHLAVKAYLSEYISVTALDDIGTTGAYAIGVLWGAACATIEKGDPIFTELRKMVEDVSPDITLPEVNGNGKGPDRIA